MDVMELLRRAQAGDGAARRDFTESQMRLVTHAVKGFYGKHPDLREDIFQVGCIGLIKAMDRFDPNFGTKWSTYAVPMVVGEVRRFIRDHNTPGGLHIPRPMMDGIMRSGQEIHIHSTETPIYHGGDGNELLLGDLLGDTDPDMERAEVRVDALDALRLLDGRTREIVLRHVDGQRQADIAAAVGISQAQVSREILAVPGRMGKIREGMLGMRKYNEEDKAEAYGHYLELLAQGKSKTQAIKLVEGNDRIGYATMFAYISRKEIQEGTRAIQQRTAPQVLPGGLGAAVPIQAGPQEDIIPETEPPVAVQQAVQGDDVIREAAWVADVMDKPIGKVNSDAWKPARVREALQADIMNAERLMQIARNALDVLDAVESVYGDDCRDIVDAISRKYLQDRKDCRLG